MKNVQEIMDENGNWYGWGRVLDYIGIGWEEMCRNRRCSCILMI